MHSNAMKCSSRTFETLFNPLMKEHMEKEMSRVERKKLDIAVGLVKELEKDKLASPPDSDSLLAHLMLRLTVEALKSFDSDKAFHSRKSQLMKELSNEVLLIIAMEGVNNSSSVTKLAFAFSILLEQMDGRVLANTDKDYTENIQLDDCDIKIEDDQSEVTTVSNVEVRSDAQVKGSIDAAIEAVARGSSTDSTSSNVGERNSRGPSNYARPWMSMTASPLADLLGNSSISYDVNNAGPSTSYNMPSDSMKDDEIEWIDDEKPLKSSTSSRLPPPFVIKMDIPTAMPALPPDNSFEIPVPPSQESIQNLVRSYHKKLARLQNRTVEADQFPQSSTATDDVYIRDIVLTAATTEFKCFFCEYQLPPSNDLSLILHELNGHIRANHEESYYRNAKKCKSCPFAAIFYPLQQEHANQKYICFTCRKEILSCTRLDHFREQHGSTSVGQSLEFKTTRRRTNKRSSTASGSETSNVKNQKQ